MIPSAALALFLFATSTVVAVEGPGQIAAQVGTMETLLESGTLDLTYFPDGQASLLPPSATAPFRMIFPAGVSTVLVEGTTMRQLQRMTTVMTKGGKGDIDNGYAGICSIHRHGDGKLYGFYHAEDQEDMPELGHGIPGFYCRICVAISEDQGFTWRKCGPCITSAKDKRDAPAQQRDRGVGEVSTVVNRERTHLLAYYTEHSRIDGRGVQICVARTSLVGAPVAGNWEKFHDGRFSQPGIGGLDTPILSAIGMDGADALFPQVSFSRYLGRYVMVFNLNAWRDLAREEAPPKHSGICVSYSDDGLAWSPPDRIIQDFSVATLGRSVSWHPTILWDDDDQRHGTIIYSYSGNWGATHQSRIPHYMVARNISFQRFGPATRTSPSPPP